MCSPAVDGYVGSSGAMSRSHAEASSAVEETTTSMPASVLRRRTECTLSEFIENKLVCACHRKPVGK